MVFETAIRIEGHLIATSHRIATFMENVVGEEVARLAGEDALDRDYQRHVEAETEFHPDEPDEDPK